MKQPAVHGERPPDDTSYHGGNMPVYDERGRRIVIRDCWRRPMRPFAAPECCGVRSKRIGRNVYRCTKCAARMWPERLYHRVLLWWNPFGREDRPVWRLFHVHRWAPVKSSKRPGVGRLLTRRSKLD